MNHTARDLQQLVTHAMNAILVDHDRGAVRKAFHPDFVQHNPWAEDGGAHVEAMCDFTFGVEMARWIIQGDLVAYHGLYTAPNPLGDQPLLCVDVWRVQGDQIVEHWDALLPTPPDVASAMLAGNGDGLADVAPAAVARNAAAARRMLEAGVNAKDFASVRSGLAEGFVDRAPEDGNAASFVAALEAEAPTYDIRHTIASGDLVLTHAAVRSEGRDQVVFDIFRFDDAGTIAEHWAVAQDRVPLSEAANLHPHF